jgi:RNA polymerase sigma factor (sigma-70 family)
VTSAHAVVGEALVGPAVAAAGLGWLGAGLVPQLARVQSRTRATTALDADRRAQRNRIWIFSSQRADGVTLHPTLRRRGGQRAGVLWDTAHGFLRRDANFPERITFVMSTDESPATSNSLMESQAAAAAAVEASVEACSESLTFDDFYRKEHRHVLGLAFVLTGNQWVAEDTAQDAFTAAFRRWRFIVAYDSPGAWVRRVVCNRAASVVRRRVREAKALMRLAGRTQLYIELDEGDEAFWQAVRRLPPRQAQAVALYYMEDYSVREIAEVLDCSEGTVKTHLSRARDAVARQLQLEDAE